MQGFSTLAQEYGQARYDIPAPTNGQPKVVDFDHLNLISPREAFFSQTETLPVEKSCDRISAELVCPYPPGIPVLMPGEVITPSALKYLQQVLAMGGVISGCADPSLRHVEGCKSMNLDQQQPTGQ